MKKTLKKTILATGITLFSSYSNGQEVFSKIVNGGKEDANKIANAYAGDLLGALGNNLNNGWYSTADPLKLGRFKLELNFPLTFPHQNQKSFSPAELGLQNIECTKSSAPTAFGSLSESADFNVVKDINGTKQTLTSFNLKGSSLPVLPMIAPQLNVGLIFDTEIMFRYLPEVEVKGFKSNSWGLGIKHDIKQWIPVINKMPFSLSVIGAYSKLNASYNFNDKLMPSDFNTVPLLDLNGQNAILPKPDLTGQSLNLNTTSWNVNLIASKKLPFLTFFGGLRLLHTSSTLSLDGNFPIKTIDTRTTVDNVANTNLGKTANSFIADPLKLEYQKTSFGLNAGTRIKLGIVSILVDGTYIPGGFSSITTGIGVGFFN
jgi:hypothetical protein